MVVWFQIVTLSPLGTCLSSPYFAKASGYGSTTRTVCVAGQDQATDCRVCQGVIPLCTPCEDDAACAGMISQVSGVPSKCNPTAKFCE